MSQSRGLSHYREQYNREADSKGYGENLEVVGDQFRLKRGSLILSWGRCIWMLSGYAKK